MLELNSARWAELRHAYGKADNLPDLLSRLRGVDQEALDVVFGSVCHQASVYPASFAAVPHLVAAAVTQADTEFRAQLLILVGSICASTDFRGVPEDVADLREAYQHALPEALECAVATLREPIDTDSAIYLLEAAAALKGFLGPGRVLSGFSGEEFAPTCPGCDRQLYVWPENDRLSVRAEEPVSKPGAPCTFTRPGPEPGADTEAAFLWLRALAQQASTLGDVERLLPHLFGVAVCPACGSSFGLMERLSEEAS